MELIKSRHLPVSYTHLDVYKRQRLGGDEFLVFAKDIDNIETIKEIAERLNQKVRKEITLMENHIYLTVSTGIVLSKRFTNFEELYVLADKMLYEVKEKNKNGYKIYNNN